jgi:virulence-associated protein VapD
LARESRRRYAINFDLTIAQLRKHYDKDHPKSAYGKIKRYMLKHGFSHRQWSGYISNGTMSRTDLVDFTTALHREFPWLIKCEGSMDATVITDIFDIKQMILDIESEDVDMGL